MHYVLERPRLTTSHVSQASACLIHTDQIHILRVTHLCQTHTSARCRSSTFFPSQRVLALHFIPHLASPSPLMVAELQT